MIGDHVSSPVPPGNPVNSIDLRSCLGKFATGVTVVTCCDGSNAPCGVTANSFSSVSLDPPLILWNIAKVSHSLQAYLDARYFAINILSDEQQDLSSHFAKTDHTLFKNVAYEISENGAPILPDTLACLECRTQQIHDCGDHYIIVGEVEKFRSSDRTPLLFFGGQYRGMATTDA
jgi:flavin reductase (DIM6/NTAB) family NADH-FMN oxidoreductase RutF